MAIIVRLDRILADRKMPSNVLAERVGLSENNLSRIKRGHIKAMRFSTLNGLCRELGCTPGDLFEYEPDEEEDEDGPLI